MGIKKKIVLNPLSGQFDLITKSLPATNVDFTPTGGVISTNVQAAIAELDTKKQAAGNYISALTGDVSATGPGSAPATLATVNPNVGSFGTASSVPTLSLNAKGLTTSAANTPIQITEAQVTNLVTDLASKQPTGNYITALTGDGAASGPGSTALTLSTVNATVGTFGTASSVPTLTVNAKGLTTAVANTAIQITEAQVTNLVTDLASKQPAGNYITALTGDIAASGPGSAASTLATVNANVGSFGSASSVMTQTVNAKGLTTAAASVPIQITEAQVTNLVTDLASKQATGNYITALTGDATAAGPGSAAITLATVNANVGTFNSPSSTTSITVNAKGLITAASTTPIQITEAQVTNLVTDLASKQPTGNYITALTGDITASGPGSAPATLATVNATPGTYGTASSVSTVVVNAKGLATSITNTPIQITETQVTNLVTDLASKQITSNLIANGDAESAVVSIFVPYANAASSRPVDGIGGAPTVTTSITSTAPLTNLKSYLLTKPATNVQGQGWAVPFTAPLSTLAKSLKISADYIINSGTFVSGENSTPSDGDVIWYIYDVTNSQLIEPSNFKMFSNSSTLSDRFEATFQTSATGTSYRLIAHVASASALAYTLKVDNISVAPNQAVFGSPVTDWLTLTGLSGSMTTNTTYTGKRRRLGDTYEYVLNAAFTGAPNAATLSFNIPDTIDTTKLVPGTSLTSAILGFGTGAITGANKAFQVLYNTTTSVIVTIQTTFTGNASGVTATSAGNISNGDNVSITFCVPILGVSSSTRLSDGYDGRVIATSASLSAPQSIATGTEVKIIFNTISGGFDKTSSLNTTTGTVTIPSAGPYKISGSVNYTPTSAAFDADVRVKINGVNFKLQSQGKSGTTVTSLSIAYDFRYDLKAGDLVEIYTSQGSGSTLSIRGNTAAQDITVLNIEKLSGSQTISASEKIRMSYSSSSGQSIASGGSGTVFTPNVRDWDSHGIFNTSTGEITFPKAGQGKLTIACLLSATGVTSTMFYSINKDGVEIKEISRLEIVGGTARNYSPPSATIEIDGLSGTKYTVKIFQNTGGALTLLNSTAYNHIQFSME